MDEQSKIIWNNTLLIREDPFPEELANSKSPKKPRFYRPMHTSTGYTNKISWEIYSWKSWFVTVSVGNFEMQLNKWPC